MEQTIVNRELVTARAPQQIGMMGMQMVGPTLIQFGTDEQQRNATCRRSSPPTRSGARATPSPARGSDLAVAARRAPSSVGDEFIVNGQKVWTSNAQIADWMFCLVRTDPDGAEARAASPTS